jgi:uncharacterized protein (TIGR00369 family)
MKLVENPFANTEGYNCFGCSPDNPIGLRLNFHEEGDEILTEWQPSKDYQGYKGILHGGIQATLMDEIASWVVFAKLKKVGFTSRLNVRYRKSVSVNEGPVSLKAKVVSERHRLVEIEITLADKNGTICAEATAQYFTYNHKESGHTPYFPGV